MRYSVRHQTQYHYTEPVSISYNKVHTHPCPTFYQTFRSQRLTIEPEPAFLSSQADFFDNPVSIFTVQKSHQKLNVVVEFEVDVEPRNWKQDSQLWLEVAQLLQRPKDQESLDASQFLWDSSWVQRSAALREFAAPSFSGSKSILEGALDLCQRIYDEFEFDSTATTVATPLERVLELRRGVCQDFSHLAVGALRSLGLAARYVSGYLLTIPPPGQARLQGADASHAWLSVWCPLLGWIDFDPTNNVLVSDQHVTLAWGRDYHDVCPLRGVVLGGGVQTVQVGVDVFPVNVVRG